MPRNPDMTWVPSNRLWRKVYRGKVYAISCRQLRQQGYAVSEDTKTGSYLAANLWWSRKEDEIEAAQRPPAPFYTGPEQWAWPYVPFAMNDWEEFITGLGLPKEAEEQHLHEYAQAIVKLFFQQHILEGRPLPEHMAQLLPPARAQQLLDGVKALRGEPAATPDKTLKAHAEAWLQRQQALVNAGQMTAARAANNRTCLAHFSTFLGLDSDVAGIDADKWDQFYLWLLSPDRRSERGLAWSVAYRKDVFSVARAFVRWLWSKKVIELPRNIDQKFKAGPAAKTVKTWTREDFKTAVREAPNKLKLALLLMANCGMTQKDVADLRKDEVDWKEGRITRKRSKTKGHGNVPTVSYKLWPATYGLLAKHQDQGNGDLVLLTEKGEPYVRSKLREDGRLSGADGFASHFVHLRARLKKNGIQLGPLKELRKLGATYLGGHPTYDRFQHYFLGHSPRSQADRHYDAKSAEFKALFDEAVLWLGKELGQVESSVSPPT
jgi:integrase